MVELGLCYTEPYIMAAHLVADVVLLLPGLRPVKAVAEALPASSLAPGLGEVVAGGVPGYGLVLGARLGHLLTVLLVDV